VKPFIAALVGGAAGGAWVVSMHVYMTAVGVTVMTLFSVRFVFQRQREYECHGEGDRHPDNVVFIAALVGGAAGGAWVVSMHVYMTAVGLTAIPGISQAGVTVMTLFSVRFVFQRQREYECHGEGDRHPDIQNGR
jgi:lipid-A-disaccharide synthase-like uncharacterized protein